MDSITKFDFAAEHLDSAIARIEKANSRAIKAGITQRFSYTTQSYISRTYNEDTAVFEETERVELILNVPSVQLSGWTFVATLSWDAEAGLITRVVPGQTLGYRPTTCECQVCNTIRDRKDTYVVRSEDGEYMQVGHNCLQRFLGIKPTGLWCLDFAMELRGLEDELRGHKVEARYSVKEVMQAALAVIHYRGWLSRKAAADKGLPSTSSHMFMYLTNTPVGKEDRFLMEVIWGAMPKHADEAAEIIEMVKGMTDASEYITNLRALVASETVSLRNMPLLISAYAACQTRKQQAAAVSAVKVNEYIGAVGAKVSFAGTVKSMRLIDGMYTSTLIEFETADGSKVKWFASGNHEDDYAVGQQVKVAGTVKTHDQFRGEKATIITRAKVS